MQDFDLANVAYGSNRYRFGRDHLSTNVRFPSNTDRKFWALGFVAKGQNRTYAVQQNRAFRDLAGVGSMNSRAWD